MKRIKMPRRSFLRASVGGALVALGLPALEPMFNSNGTALADGGPLPTRFGLWFWGNGIVPETWVPEQTGRGWTPTPQLMPLLPHREHFSLLTGYELKFSTNEAHHAGTAGILSGAPHLNLGMVRGSAVVSTFTQPSVDVYAARAWQGLTPYDSLELGITRFRGTDEGDTMEHTSHLGPHRFNAAEYSPHRFFARIFGAGPLTAELRASHHSVLDVVLDQAGDLRRDLSHTDRARLDQHLDGIRAIERRLDAVTRECAAPAEPMDLPDVNGIEPIEMKSRLMADMLGVALACDLTRVFTITFCAAGSRTPIPEGGMPDSWHATAHEEQPPWTQLTGATTFTMARLGDWMDMLHELPDGDGTMLDHTSMLATSDLSKGSPHLHTEYPLIIAGGGSGRLTPGIHHRSTTMENAVKGTLTALRGAGVEVASFGTDVGYVEESVSEIGPGV